MSKQLMIYDDIQPISEKHLKWSVNVENYAFTAEMNSAPVLATEIVYAADEYPIIFSPTSTEGEYIPLAVMGLKDGENLLLDADNRLITRYVPAFIRRYPFVLGGTKDTDMMALCVDEASSSLDHEGTKGHRLFDDAGGQSDYFKEVVEFLKDYHFRADLTRTFTKHLHQLGLLEPMSANITINGKEPSTLNVTGFYVVNRDKLKSLGDSEVLDLFKKDGLELIYAHLSSLSNFNRLIDILSKKESV